MATLLVITVFLPLVGSLVLFLTPGLDMKSARAIALGTVLATLAFSLVLVAGFRAGRARRRSSRIGRRRGPTG